MKSLTSQLKDFQESSDKARGLADEIEELVRTVAGFDRPAHPAGSGGAAGGGAGGISGAGSSGSVNMGGGGGPSAVHEPGSLDMLEAQAVRLSGHHSRIESAIKRLAELLGVAVIAAALLWSPPAIAQAVALPDPVTIKVTRQQLLVIGQGLQELPAKIANPLLNELQAQLNAADHAAAKAAEAEKAAKAPDQKAQ